MTGTDGYHLHYDPFFIDGQVQTELDALVDRFGNELCQPDQQSGDQRQEFENGKIDVFLVQDLQTSRSLHLSSADHDVR